MLNFKNTNILFLTVLLLITLVHFLWILPYYWFIPVIILYALVLFYGSYYVGSNFFMKVLCEGKTTLKEIAISFDDGPATQFSPAILEILKARQVPAAFFCIGSRIAGQQYLITRAIEEGHVIGNHSFSHHFWYDLMGAKKMQADITQMSETVKNTTGLYPLMFRPPYGVTTPNMKKSLDRSNFTAVGWNIRSMDTVIKDEKKLLNKILSQLKPGAIILLHDTSATTLAILPKLIDEARKNGYNFIRLDKLLNIKPYA